MTSPKPDARSLHAQETSALLALGLPLVGSHLAQMSIHVSDILMLGWYDITSLAAASVAGPIFFVLFILGSGFAWAVMPMVASAAGTADDAQVRRVTRMGLWLSALAAAIFSPLLFLGEPALLLLGQEADVSERAGVYMAYMGVGLLPALLTMVLKSYLSALELTRAILAITILSSAVNILLNYMLIFGNFGFPELGIEGAGLASVIGNLVGIAALVVFVTVRTPQYTLFQNFHRPDWDAFGQVFRLGWPIGLTSLAEVSAFAAAGIMMGWVGKIPLAAHGIALQIASITFMMHLGLSQAVTVRAGRAWGRRDMAVLRAASIASLVLSAGAVALTVCMFLLIPEALISLFVDPDDPARVAIVAAGVVLLAVAALFQAVDAAQVMALGMLRGVQDTRIPMIMAAVSYWGIGMPAGYVLAFPIGLGGPGVWLGLSIGLGCAAVLMQHRYWARFAAA